MYTISFVVKLGLLWFSSAKANLFARPSNRKINFIFRNFIDITAPSLTWHSEIVMYLHACSNFRANFKQLHNCNTSWCSRYYIIYTLQISEIRRKYDDLEQTLVTRYKEAERDVVSYADVSLHEQNKTVIALVNNINRVAASRNQVPL